MESNRNISDSGITCRLVLRFFFCVNSASNPLTQPTGATLWDTAGLRWGQGPVSAWRRGRKVPEELAGDKLNVVDSEVTPQGQVSGPIIQDLCVEGLQGSQELQPVIRAPMCFEHFFPAIVETLLQDDRAKEAHTQSCFAGAWACWRPAEEVGGRGVS